MFAVLLTKRHDLQNSLALASESQGKPPWSPRTNPTFLLERKAPPSLAEEVDHHHPEEIGHPASPRYRSWPIFPEFPRSLTSALKSHQFNPQESSTTAFTMPLP